MNETILFYTSAEPGAAPFVRVPATPEGLRYAGYYARYRGLPIVGPRAIAPDTDTTGAEHAKIIEGYFGYPTNPGIPLGTERYTGDGMWSRYAVHHSGLLYWEHVPEGAPPPRGGS